MLYSAVDELGTHNDSALEQHFSAINQSMRLPFFIATSQPTRTWLFRTSPLFLLPLRYLHRSPGPVDSAIFDSPDTQQLLIGTRLFRAPQSPIICVVGRSLNLHLMPSRTRSPCVHPSPPPSLPTLVSSITLDSSRSPRFLPLRSWFALPTPQPPFFFCELPPIDGSVLALEVGEPSSASRPPSRPRQGPRTPTQSPGTDRGRDYSQRLTAERRVFRTARHDARREGVGSLLAISSACEGGSESIDFAAGKDGGRTRAAAVVVARSHGAAPSRCSDGGRGASRRKCGVGHRQLDRRRGPTDVSREIVSTARLM